MFKHKKKKTGSSVPPQATTPPMPEMNITGICQYETPCGWCTKWDKKCDKKIGVGVDDKPQRGLRANADIFDDYAGSELNDIRSGNGLSRLDTNLDPNKPLPSGIRKEFTND